MTEENGIVEIKNGARYPFVTIEGGIKGRLGFPESVEAKKGSRHKVRFWVDEKEISFFKLKKEMIIIVSNQNKKDDTIRDKFNKQNVEAKLKAVIVEEKNTFTNPTRFDYKNYKKDIKVENGKEMWVVECIIEISEAEYQDCQD